MISNKEQFGEKGMDVLGICIHNTGNSLSARENYQYMENTKLNLGTHFFVDDKEVIQAMPTNWKVWHTGKGRDWGNMHCIAIEICQSQSPSYLKAQERAIQLIKELMDEFNLTVNDIYFHQDFNNQKYCPHKILDLYGNKKTFIKEVFKCSV